jgi:hypothetical protein
MYVWSLVIVIADFSPLLQEYQHIFLNSLCQTYEDAIEDRDNGGAKGKIQVERNWLLSIDEHEAPCGRPHDSYFGLQRSDTRVSINDHKIHRYFPIR